MVAKIIRRYEYLVYMGVFSDAEPAQPDSAYRFRLELFSFFGLGFGVEGLGFRV